MLTNFPNGISSFGIPIYGQISANVPPVGLVYFVDTSKGSDAHSGLDKDNAFATFQKAITMQIAHTEGLGDLIYVLPGSYAESLTGDLVKVQIIGVTSGACHPVSIRPTASYSYTGSMTDSAFRNIMFMSPSTSSKTKAAVLLTYMGYSTIDNCTFIGRTTDALTGLQFGLETDNATVVKCDFSQITNNVFTSFYGASSQFAYGIKFNDKDAVSTPNNKQVWFTLIAGNRIWAKTTGIHFGCGAGKIDGTVVVDNYISSHESDNGCASFGIKSLTTGSSMIIARNYIMAVDAISGFQNNCLMGNWISESGTVATELPATT